MTVTMCTNPDCRPGCGNAMTQKHFEIELARAMQKSIEDLLVCPSCGQSMQYLSRMVF